ncbi:MAG: PorT family protein [Muribaculum sp.]|nr:PorT family protein [Muribaculum sp.]
MNFKKTIAILTLAAAALPAAAEFRWGPTVGFDMSSYFWKQKLIDTKCSPGFNAGLMGEIMIPGIGFGIDIGVRYNQHGAKINFGQRPIWAIDGLGNESVRLHTLEIPLDLRFKWTRMDGLENTIAPFAYAGPVFSFTLSENEHKALEYPAGSVGIQVGGGAELFEHWQISAGYIWGISYEIRTIKLDNFSARRQGWNINVTYLF